MPIYMDTLPRRVVAFSRGGLLAVGVSVAALALVIGIALGCSRRTITRCDVRVLTSPVLIERTSVCRSMAWSEHCPPLAPWNSPVNRGLMK